MTKIKICCIQSVDEAETAILAGADALGLVGQMPSGPGPIGDDQIRDIAVEIGDRALTVLLSSETTAKGLVAHADFCRTRAIQLVDEVEPDAIPALRKAHPDLTVLQVIHVRSEDDVEAAMRAAAVADMLLLDSGAPEKAIRQLGGTGRVHDWSLSRRIVSQSPVPVWLAGGLNPDNAATAVSQVSPFGLDICSGLRPDGVLDAQLLKSFVARTRGDAPA